MHLEAGAGDAAGDGADPAVAMQDEAAEPWRDDP